MVNGDILTDLDPNKLRNTNTASLALVPLRSPYGVVEVDDHSNVTGFLEKPVIKDKWINAGVYHFTRDVFHLLPENGNIEITALPNLVKSNKLQGIRYANSFWRSIDSHKDIEDATKEIESAAIV